MPDRLITTDARFCVLSEALASYAGAEGAPSIHKGDGLQAAVSVVIRGREDLIEFYRTTWPLEVKAFFTNHIIEIDGDRATGTCSLENRATRDGESLIGAGRLYDEYERVDDEWKFAKRRVEMFYFAPLSEGWAKSAGPEEI